MITPKLNICYISDTIQEISHETLDQKDVLQAGMAIRPKNQRIRDSLAHS